MEFGSLWEVLAVLVFLLAPIWRSVVETRKKAALKQRERVAGPRGAKEIAAEEKSPGLDPWEALLRGMDPERESAEAPRKSVPEPIAPVEPAVVASHEDEPESLVDFPSYRNTAYETEAYANPGDEAVGGLADELEHREEAVPRREFHSALEDRHVIGSGLSDLAPSFQEPEAQESARRRAIVALSMPESIADWRTAVVLAAVLGPPVALSPGGYRTPLDPPTL